MNCRREDVNLVPTRMRKPFDVLAEGLFLKNSRGDKTAIELFLLGVRTLVSQLSIVGQALVQSSIRRPLSTPRRNDRGSIKFHVPIDASVDGTDAGNNRTNRVYYARPCVATNLPGPLRTGASSAVSNRGMVQKVRRSGGAYCRASCQLALGWTGKLTARPTNRATSI